MKQLTQDQTLMAREISRGNLTPERAENDPRKNVLLQCIGASKIVEPEFYSGKMDEKACYLFCSDGFRHAITEAEIHSTLVPRENQSEDAMKSNLVKLIELNKEREETDNITAILIKTV